jgi:hypothetical protein
MKTVVLWAANGLMLLTMLFLVGMLIFKTEFFTSVIRQNLRALFRQGRAPRRSGPGAAITRTVGSARPVGQGEGHQDALGQGPAVGVSLTPAPRAS